jgi:hypothetical protein
MELAQGQNAERSGFGFQVSILKETNNDNATE